MNKINWGIVLILLILLIGAATTAYWFFVAIFKLIELIKLI